MIRFLTCLLALSLFNLSVIAQKSFLFTHLQTRDGLGSNMVWSIQQDKRGFVWIATQEGLQRFDGQRFLNVLPRKGFSREAANDVIYQIQFDRKERLWMLIGGFIAGYFDTNDFSFHEIPIRYDRDILAKAAGHLEVDQEGNVILTAVQVACFTFDEAGREFTENKNPFKVPGGWKPIYWWQDDKRNCYWIGCDSGLVKFNQRAGSLSYRGHNTDQDEVIRNFGGNFTAVMAYHDRSNFFWIFYWSEKGMFIKSLDLNSGKVREWQNEIGRQLKWKYYETKYLWETADGTLWLAGTNLLGRFNASRNAFLPVESDQPGEYSIRFDEVNHSIEDRENNLWFATNKGLYRCNPKAQVFRSIANRLPGEDSAHTSEVTDVLQLHNGEIWVSTWGNAIFTYDSNFIPIHSRFHDRKARRGEMMTWCLYQHSNGDIWSGEQGGIIYVYRMATGKTEEIIDPVFEGSTIRQMVEDPGGNLWIGTQRGYLVKWDIKTGRFSLYQKFKSIISRLYADRRGNIWVGTANVGAIKIDSRTGTVMEWYKKSAKEGDGILGLGVADILQYDDSLFLFAGNGISILNQKTKNFSYFNKANGFPTNQVINLATDDYDRIWISSGRGIYNYDLHRRILSNFTEAEGIQSGTYIVGAGNRLKDGRIVFGTPHDLLLFNPKDIKEPDSVIPKVEITGLEVMNKSLFMDSVRNLKMLELPYTQNSLRFEFSTLTYLNQYGIRYRMEGLDKDWLGGGTIGEVVYNYLPPGDYVFHIHAENGVWQGSEDTVLAISILSPFYETWWFYGLLLAAAVGILFWIDRERMRRKESLLKMRSEIASNLHSEVNTALNNINILSEMARIKAEKDPVKSMEYIEQIHNKSHEMILSMDDMLWSIDPQNDRMQKTIERMREFIDSLNSQYNRSIDMQVDKKVEKLSLNMKFRHDSFLLFKECINGLVQAGVSLCRIHLAMEKSLLFFTIEIKNENSDLPQFRNWLKRMELEKKLAALNAKIDLQINKGSSLILLRIPLEEI